MGKRHVEDTLSPPPSKNKTAASSSSSTAGDNNNDSITTTTPAAKRVKIDENDIDFLIGDLRKEESQLVLTRLLRKRGKDDPDFEPTLRSEIEMVRTARAQMTPDQIKEQVQHLQQLTALQQLHARMSLSPQTNPGTSGFPSFVSFPSSPIPMNASLNMGVPSPMMGGGPTVAPISDSAVRAIRSQMRDAMKKLRSGESYGHTWKVDTEKVSQILAKCREMVLMGSETSLRNALDCLEAITEEFTEKGQEAGNHAIQGFEDCLAIIAQDWLDAFLSSPSDLTEEERNRWSEKLRIWDNSTEGESLLAIAKVAALNGWDEEVLAAILKGEERGEEYTEPRKLVLARLTTLERDKRLEEATNLASAANARCGLSQQLARLLLRTNRSKEALEIAQSIQDPALLFSLAQAAKPIDSTAAFHLAISAVSVDNNSWSQQSRDRANWLVDLANNEKKLGDLVSECIERIWHKPTAWELCKVFVAKRMQAQALQLGLAVATPYPLERLQKLWTTRREAEKQRKKEQGIVVNAKDEPVMPTTRMQLISSLYGTAVPNSIIVWLIDLAHTESKHDGKSHVVKQTLDSILAVSEDTQELINLMNRLSSLREYTLLDMVGARCLDLISQHEKMSAEYMEREVRERHALSLQPVEKDKLAPVYLPHPVDHPSYSYEDTRFQVVRQMLDAATTHKSQFINPPPPPPTNSTDMEIDTKKQEEEERIRLQELAKCSEKLQNVVNMSIVQIPSPDQLLTLAQSCSNGQEYLLALRILEKAVVRVDELEVAREETEEWRSQLSALQLEKNVLTNQRVQMDDDKKKKLEDLELKQKLFDQLTPSYARKSQAQHTALKVNLAANMIRFAINSKSARQPSERMSQDAIEAVVDNVLTIVQSPISLLDQIIPNLNTESLLLLKVADQIVSSVKGIRENVATSVVLRTEKAFIEQEKAALPAPVAGKKASLPTELEERLAELTKEVEALPPVAYHLPTSPKQVEDLLSRTMNEMISAATRNVTRIEAIINTPSQDRTKQQEAELQDELKAAQAKEEEVFEACLSNLTSLEAHRTLVNAVGNKPDWIRRVFQQAVPCAHKLEEERVAFYTARDEQGQLEEEQRQLASNNLLLPKDKAERLRQLKLENCITHAKNITGLIGRTADQITEMVRDLGDATLRAFVNEQGYRFSRLRQLRERPVDLERLVFGLDQKAATKAMEAAVAAAKAEEQQLEEHLTKLEQEISGVVMEILGTIEDPNHLLSTTSILSNPSLDVQNMHFSGIDLLKVVVEHVMTLLEGMDKTRREAGPTTRERIVLLVEQEELAGVKKTLPQDKKDRLNELERNFRQFCALASYKRLNANEIQEINQQAATALVNAIAGTTQAVYSQMDQLTRKLNAPKEAGADKANKKSADPNAPQPSQAESTLAELSDKMASSSLLPVPPAPKVLLEQLTLREEVLTRQLSEAIDLVFERVRDPNGLVALCTCISDKVVRRPFTALVERIGRRALELNAELGKVAAEREPVWSEIETLEDEADKLKQVNKQLTKAQRQRLDELYEMDAEWSLSPDFELQGHEQHDETASQAIVQVITALVRERTFETSSIRSSKGVLQAAENPDAMEVDTDRVSEAQKVIGEMSKLLGESTAALEAFVNTHAPTITNPTHSMSLASLLSSQDGTTDLAISTCMLAIERAKEAQSQLDACAKAQRLIYLLKAEAKQLADKREQPSDEHVKLLQDTEAAFEALPDPKYGLNDSGSRPYSDGETDNKAGNQGHRRTRRSFGYMTLPDGTVLEDESVQFVSRDMYNLIRQAACLVINACIREEDAFLAEAAEAQRLEKPLADADERKDKLKEKLKEKIDMVLDKLEDYKAVEAVLSILQSNRRHEAIFQVCESCILQLADMRKRREPLDEEEVTLDKLEEEKNMAESQRRSLAADKLALYYDLHLKHDMRAIEPGFRVRTTNQINGAILRVFRAMLGEALRFQTQAETEMQTALANPRLARADSMDTGEMERQHAKRRAEIQEDLAYVVDLCVNNIVDPRHLVDIVNELNNHRQYPSLIKVGNKAQEILAADLELQEKREALLRKKAELQAKQISQTSVDKNLQDVMDEIEQLGKPGDFSSTQLRQWVLQVANLMIDAARLEHKDDVVLVQSILVFKMMLTLEKFEEVHTLCPAKEWKTVRKDLLNYVVNHDSTAPGSPITLKMQIELLLKQGMWKETVDIFPEPQPNNNAFNTTGLEILELMWITIEKEDASELEQLLPHIERYARKQYQIFEFRALDRLLDLVQQHFPEFIVQIHKIGSEIIASNMGAKQYNDYCVFLKNLRTRLEGLNMKKQWNDFIAAVRQEHSRKKKLINIFNAFEL